jgi:5'(3')-deoxyribonucleotidase
MKIGFDVDGVLANFVPAYQNKFVEVTGRDAFEPMDILNPPCWDWPTLRGYTKEDTGKVWASICADPNFWLALRPLWGNVRTLGLLAPSLEKNHDVYFITSRPGVAVKRQTEEWLRQFVAHYQAQDPTVLIVGHRVKGLVAKALKLDVYIDDNLDNVNDCARESIATRTYLLDAAYNQAGEGEEELDPLVIRVDTLGQMFDHELSHL